MPVGSEGTGTRQGGNSKGGKPIDNGCAAGRDKAFRALPSATPEAHLEAIDVQDGDRQCVLTWGDQRIDPGDEPAEQQRVQDLGDGVPGEEVVLGWGGTVGARHLEARAERAVGSPGIHGTFHSQGAEDLLSHCLLGKDMAPSGRRLTSTSPGD